MKKVMVLILMVIAQANYCMDNVSAKAKRSPTDQELIAKLSACTVAEVKRQSSRKKLQDIPQGYAVFKYTPELGVQHVINVFSADDLANQLLECYDYNLKRTPHIVIDHLCLRVIKKAPRGFIKMAGIIMGTEDRAIERKFLLERLMHQTVLPVRDHGKN